MLNACFANQQSCGTRNFADIHNTRHALVCMNIIDIQFSMPTTSKLKCKKKKKEKKTENMKLAKFDLCTLMNFTWYKLPSCSAIAVISSSIPLTIHLLRLNCIFNSFDKSLLQICLQFGHMKDFFYANPFDFAVH